LRASHSDATSPADRQVQRDVADHVFLATHQAAAADLDENVESAMKRDGRCKPLGVNGNASEIGVLSTKVSGSASWPLCCRPR
jgi:hypothetical protein